jgi:hypothetical protein
MALNNSEIYGKVFSDAATKLGGIAQLAEHLRVSKSEMEEWCKGEGDPPQTIFLDAVDVLLQN